MRVEWYGQSAFHLSAGEATGGDRPVRRHLRPRRPRDAVRLPADRGSRGGSAAGDARARRPQRRRGDRRRTGDPALDGRAAESPLGEVMAIASEHDEQAGTARGPNTIFVFELDGLRVCHFGDFGQSAMREEQAEAIGDGRPADRARRRRADDRRGAGGCDRRAPVAAVGGADALPHAAHRLPRDRRGLPGALARTSSACRRARFETDALPHRATPAGGRPGGAVGRGRRACRCRITR